MKISVFPAAGLSVCLFFATAALAQSVIPAPEAAPVAKPVTIRVALDRPIAPYKPLFAWFGMDEANYATTRLGGKLLRELHDLSPVTVSIRSHHLLTSGNGVPELKWSSTNVYSEDAKGHPVYDFKILDGIFDAYKAAGVQPMVELGFMPKALASGTGEYRDRFPGFATGGTVQSPPKDYAKWGALVRNVVAHLARRYGAATVRQWYFEVWNEPDIDYWHGTPAQYFKLYDYAAAGVKAALPGARVGGPATTSPSDPKGRDFLIGFLTHVTRGKSAVDGGKVPLDFISFHAKGAPKIQGGDVRMGLRHELDDVQAGFAVIAKFPALRGRPILISEADPEGCAACSSKMNPANAYRNGTLYPAYTAAAYKGMFALQDRYKTDLRAMLSWSFEFEGRDYFEGFRSLSSNGIDKPILNFFRMAGMMRGMRVTADSDGAAALDDILSHGVDGAPDVDALATRDRRQAAIMVWNYRDEAAAAPPVPVTVAIQGLPKNVRRVLVAHYRIDQTHSNAYTAWQAMGSPQAPTPEQYARLRRAGGLQLMTSPVWMAASQGALTVRTQMPHESVSLLRLIW
jgi:xylan 1,4-beta-xylosidase